VSSEILEVVFFEDRAEVKRRERFTLPAGSHKVTVEGLALTVDDPSLVAGLAASAPARVLAARVHRRTRTHTAANAAEIEAIEKDLQLARNKSGAAQRGLLRAQAEQQRLTALEEKWAAAVERVPRGGDAEMQRWRTAHESVETALLRALDECDRFTAELTAAQLDEQRANLRLLEGRQLVPRYEASAEVQLEVFAEGANQELTLELAYRTPLALWRPEHTARLVEKAGSWELVWKTHATVWQRTGEEWRDVHCRFSTARPTSAASPPLLGDDVLFLQRKQEKATIVEAREQTIAAAGLDRGARAVQEMPGVEDGGEPLSFEAPRPVTIPSDGQPFRVELSERRMPCTVDMVVHPERGEAAHVRATATLTGGGPILAGPLRLARGNSMVGRSKIAFIAEGEPFEVGFGVDDGLRVKRRVDEERDTTPVIGTQKWKRTLKLYLSNLGGEARRLNVVERIPVSEIEDVEIQVLDPGGAQIDKDGFARFGVELAGNATRELMLVYKVEAAAKVRLTL
jgi:uncharacterized protein (TIGR02231 family)